MSSLHLPGVERVLLLLVIWNPKVRSATVDLFNFFLGTVIVIIGVTAAIMSCPD
jgi:hypothetical protein